MSPEKRTSKKRVSREEVSSNNSVLTAILLGLITLLVGGASYLLYDNHSKKTTLLAQENYIEVIQFESDSLGAALQEEINNLKILKLKYSDLEEESEEIKNLITELVKEKESWKKRSKLNHNDLLALKQKLERTISNFNAGRVSLYNKIEKLEKSATELKQTNSNLTFANDSLVAASKDQILINEEILKKASKLKPENLEIVVENSKHKVLSNSPYKSKNIAFISCVFNLSKNDLAIKGQRLAIMRIEKPDGGILYDISSNCKTFVTSGQEEKYCTASQSIDFRNNYESVNLLYTKIKDLSGGKYNVTIYLDGEEFGKTSFNVK